ncbi:MAG: serine/threonine protein phosphatase, partial [Clostridiales bacterium]|nr:serine/threonine protein phosphatase [Clostridiales bacterium]
MRTKQRLTGAYNNARVEFIDENSKYIFFSDCHRGDGSLSDEFAKNKNIFIHALEYYYKNDFVYVEVGDGDELWEHRNAKHIITANKDVYAVIRKFHFKNRLILLYGNHNIYLKNQKYVIKNYYTYYSDYKEVTRDFLKDIHPIEALVLKHKKTGQEILTVHGHQGDFSNDQFWIFNMLSLKYFWRFLHSFGAQNPASPVKNRHK